MNIYNELLISIIQATIFVTALTLLFKSYAKEYHKENNFYSSEQGFKVFLEREKTKRLYYQYRGIKKK